MRILRHYRNPPAEAKGAVVALGNFDGVHRGHQALIAEAGRIAHETQRPLAALVFEPYPREFFRPGDAPFRLTPFRAKARLLSELGVEFLIVLGFDAEMAGKLAQDFVIDVLVRALEASHVVVGEDFRFGKGRGGDVTLLGYMGEMEGFGVTVFGAVAEGGEKISSSKVRAALKERRPEEAARLLGHWWSIEAHVASGDRRGRSLGFPTANIAIEPNKLVPALGAYAGRAIAEEGRFVAALSVGYRPTFGGTQLRVEAFLLDFEGDLYQRKLELRFVKWLHPDRTFPSPEDLVQQLRRDVVDTRRIVRP